MLDCLTDPKLSGFWSGPTCGSIDPSTPQVSPLERTGRLVTPAAILAKVGK